MSDISKIYKADVANKESLKYWDQVVPVIGEVVDNGPEAKTRAFHIGKTNNIDQVFKFKAAIGSALAEGKTFRDFLNDKNVAQVTEECDLSAWHLETIFRTNMQSAYAAGRYAEMQSAKKSRPYWRYVAIHDGRTRPEHAALDKVVYPANDPFWDVNFPPNGFNCRCAVVSMSEAEVKRKGLTISHTELDEGEEVAPINPAFGNNPGKNWMAGLERKGDLSITQVTDLNNYKNSDYLTIKESDLLPDRQTIIASGNEPEKYYADAFLNEFGIKDLNKHKLLILPGFNYPVIISKQLILDKEAQDLKVDKQGRGRYMKILAQAIKKPHEIRMITKVAENGKRFNQLKLFQPVMLQKANSSKPILLMAIFRMALDPRNVPTGLISKKVWVGQTTYNCNGKNYADRMLNEKGNIIWKGK